MGLWQTSKVAISKWIKRKSFAEAMEKAEKIRAATQARAERNSGLFTAAQENLRRDLGLHDRVKVGSRTEHQFCACVKVGTQSRASRSRLRIRLKRR